MDLIIEVFPDSGLPIVHILLQIECSLLPFDLKQLGIAEILVDHSGSRDSQGWIFFLFLTFLFFAEHGIGRLNDSFEDVKYFFHIVEHEKVDDLFGVFFVIVDSR